MSISSISPQALHQSILSKGALPLLDVRTPLEFMEIHAEGAVNIPLDQLDPKKAPFPSGQPGEPIYVICLSGSRGRKACVKLAAAGVTNIVNVEGGTLAWEAAGLAVVRGPKAISLERQVRIAAGSLVVLGCTLGALVTPYAFGLATFVGAGLVFAGVTDTCAMGLLIAKMPWNQSVAPVQPQYNSEASTTSSL